MALFTKDRPPIAVAQEIQHAAPDVPMPHTDLATCRDCLHPVSRLRCEVCPNCGARIRLSRTDQLATIIVVLAAIGFVLALFGAVAGHGR